MEGQTLAWHLATLSKALSSQHRQGVRLSIELGVTLKALFQNDGETLRQKARGGACWSLYFRNPLPLPTSFLSHALPPTTHMLPLVAA